MRFSLNNSFSILLFFSVFTFISCSKDSDEPEQIETQITVTTQDFSTTMDENPTNGQVIGTVQGNTNQGSITFSITEQNPSEAFSIDAASGELKVTDGMLFDFEINPTITGTVKVANGTVSKIAVVTISLNDISTENIYDGDVYLSSQDEVNTFGASNYVRITGFLFIGKDSETELSNISDLTPLESLNRIDGDFTIYRNGELSNTLGLGNIEDIGSNLIIGENPILISVSDLNNITSVQNDLSINENPLLEDMEGLSNITNVSGNLFFYNNPLTPNLNWMRNLSSIGKDLYIGGCKLIRTLNGLNSLRNVGPYITIENNELLENLNGLENLIATIEVLKINNNASLLNIADLNNITVTFEIIISNNKKLQNLIGLSKITYLTFGAYIVKNNSLIDLTGLDNLISSGLTVKQNQSLINLNGLNGLQYAEQLIFYSNPSLSDFCALQNSLITNLNIYYSVAGNGFDPTQQDLIDGNCSL